MNKNEAKNMKKDSLVQLIMEGYDKIAKGTDKHQHKALKDRVIYTLKSFSEDAKSVPKDVLTQLWEDLQVAIPSNVVPLPLEGSNKPKLGGKKTTEKTTEDKTETKADTKTTKGKGKANKVETTENLVEGQKPIATLFPETLQNEDYGTMIATPDKYTTIEEISEALSEGVTLVLGTYWTTRLLKEYEYAKTHNVPVPKKGFPDDLDLLQIVYVCTGVPRMYAISIYTEALFVFTEDDLERIESSTPSGETINMRYSNGLEFEIYEAEPEQEDDATEE